MAANTARCSAIVLTCLLVFLFSSHAQSTKTHRSSNFKQVSTDFKEALIFESPASSGLHCARLCSAALCCAHFLFSTDTGLCQGHRRPLTDGGDGSYRALVWERGETDCDLAGAWVGGWGEWSGRGGGVDEWACTQKSNVCLISSSFHTMSMSTSNDFIKGNPLGVFVSNKPDSLSAPHTAFSIRLCLSDFRAACRHAVF